MIALPISRLRGVVVSCAISALAACGSSSQSGVDAPVTGPEVGGRDFGKDVILLGPPDGVDATPGAGKPDAADASPAFEDAPQEVSADGPLAVDGPLASPDVPVARPDTGPGIDAYYFTTMDGRVMQLVDYCPPVRPLPPDAGTDNWSCPANLDQALARANTAPDGGWPYVRPQVVRCSEGPLYYTDLMGKVCFYDADTRLLFAYSVGYDTPSGCGDSDLASYTTAVYGEHVTCTFQAFVVVDAGS